MPADNELYNRPGDIWWDEREHLSMLRTMLNPARVRFFHDVLVHDLQLKLWRRKTLDVGCGGGILAEGFARLGFSVPGLHPSPASLTTPPNHSYHSRPPIT